MKRQQIAEEVAKRQQHIENAQDWIQRLQQMTPDEDKPVVKSWYTVHEKDGEVFVTQWLNANNVSEAMDMC